MSNAARLFHHRWTAPVLAQLHRERGSRFVRLARGLGVTSDSLRRTLAALLRDGLLERNPGYGHPLRPEYALTPQGERVAAVCDRLLALLDGLEDVGLRKWSMPVVGALDEGPRRFAELRAVLAGISPRALTLALKDLRAAGLVERTVVDEYPPASVYRLTARARPLARVVTELDETAKQPGRRPRPGTRPRS